MSISITTVKAREFHHRYQALSQNSGYNLVYDTLALLQEFIPSSRVSFYIVRPKNLNTDKVLANTTPLLIGSKFYVDTFEYFAYLYEQFPFAARFGSNILNQALSDKPIQVYSFNDYANYRNGCHSKLHTSDVLVTAGLIARKQFVDAPETDNYYGIVCNMANSNGKQFGEDDKTVLALCFDTFVDDLKNKIRTSEDSPFLPQVTGELICEKTKLEKLLSTGKKFSGRELATIRACFDLKQQKRKISAPEVARYLHLRDKEADPGTLKRLGDNVKTDIKKIKQQLLRDFTPDSPEYKFYQESFSIQHIPEVFKTYAYFGLYPDTGRRYTSYLEHRLGNLSA
jgi:hypothetical protein